MQEGFSDRGAKRLAPSMDKLLAQFKESERRVFVTSSRADELSKEGADKGHSLFTYYLLEGFSGKAAADENGIITLQAVYDYIYQKTKKASGGFQSPQWAGLIVGTFPLAMSRPLFDSGAAVRTEKPKRAPRKGLDLSGGVAFGGGIGSGNASE